uniref:Small EDRK-rich factor-like N-terminal domain-containing protein n=1 Tax=Ixodes ricinus TaxID=34613 RepID=V5GXJ3_IXORI
MTRGNQRELARAKNAKKQQESTKKKGAHEKDGNRGLTLEERRHRASLSDGKLSFIELNSEKCEKSEKSSTYWGMHGFVFRDAEVMRLKQKKALESGGNAS